MKYLLIFLIAYMGTATALAQHVSNGGNWTTTEFITRSRLIHRYLTENPSAAVNAKIDLAGLQKAIDRTIVEVSLEGTLYDTLGRSVDAYVTPIPCVTIGTCRIVLRRDFWDKNLKTNPQIYRLVLHEYLRVMNLHDENNEISALLDMDPEYFGRGGVVEVGDLANLDFEIPNDGFELPLFWYISSVNLGYRIEIDDSVGYQSNSSLLISSDYTRPSVFYAGQAQPFGTVVQCFDAKPYWGKAIHLSGYIKTANLFQGSAGLWMRIDQLNGQTRILDNMANRAVYGTAPWRRSDVILYVEDESADKICFGALLMGVGSARFDQLRVRVIDDD